MNLLQKAQAGLNLTPGERAILKTLQSLFITALIAGLIAAAQYLTAPGEVNWTAVGYAVVIAIIFSFAHGLAKYVTASGDLPLGSALEAVTSAAEQKLPQTLQGPLVVIHQNSATTSIEPPITTGQSDEQVSIQNPVPALLESSQTDADATAKLPIMARQAEYQPSGI